MQAQHNTPVHTDSAHATHKIVREVLLSQLPCILTNPSLSRLQSCIQVAVPDTNINLMWCEEGKKRSPFRETKGTYCHGRPFGEQYIHNVGLNAIRLPELS